MSGLVCIRRAGGSKFQILGVATVKLRAPNEVRTNGTESRLVFENLSMQMVPVLVSVYDSVLPICDELQNC